MPLLLFRVSFTGELGFEINVPAAHGLKIWEAVHAAGSAHGITAYGTETMHVLRAEKGYIIIGQDTDGTVTPDDAGLSWAIGKNKTDFVGKRSLERSSMTGRDPQTTGRPAHQGPAHRARGRRAGRRQSRPKAAHGIDRSCDFIVCSSVWAIRWRSALVAGGRARLGQTLYVPMPHGDIPVEVTSPVFYDPQGARINA